MSKLTAAIQQGAGPRPPSQYERFRAQINAVRKDVAVLVGDRNVDKFIRVCLNAVQHNPDTLNADRRSLLLACLEAAQDGLMPDGTEAVFNIYGTKDKEQSKSKGRDIYVDIVQYLPMAYGLVQKIYESGATYVDAVAVYQKDEFEYQRGDTPSIVHRPYRGDDSPGPVVAAYAVVKYPNLETKREVMWRREIEAVRGKSKAKDGMMWKDFYDQGAIKSVIHRINKQLPQSERLNRVLAHDNKAVGLAGVEVLAEDAGANLADIVDANVVLVVEDKTAEQKQRDEVLGNGTVPAGKVAEGVAAPGAVVTGAAAPANQASTAAAGTDAPTGAADAKPVPPKKGDPGTAELKATFLTKMQGCNDPDALDIIMDDARFFKWAEADLKGITEAYSARRGVLRPHA